MAIILSFLENYVQTMHNEPTQLRINTFAIYPSLSSSYKLLNRSFLRNISEGAGIQNELRKE